MKRPVKDVQKVCCDKCNITDGCLVAAQECNQRDGLCLLDETFSDLFKWYNGKSKGWRDRENPKLWKEVRRQWKLCCRG